jgi:ElaB/YqjD/DUF883 family membrane-anchored ribosome-binding protein
VLSFARREGAAARCGQQFQLRKIMAEQNQNQGGQGNSGGQGQGGGTQGAGGQSTAGAGARLESSKTHVRQAADELRTAATEIAGEYRGKAEQAWEDATVRARTLQEDGEEYVRENPTKAVFTALGIGFVLGMLFRR